MAANFVALAYAVLIWQPALVVKYALAIVMLAAVLPPAAYDNIRPAGFKREIRPCFVPPG